MIALVTGATGFVGREVVKALFERGVEVRCLIHTPGRERVLSGSAVDIHYGSVQDPVALQAAFYNVDAVVHLVALIRESGSATFETVNHRGTQNVVAAARDAGAGHFLQMSAIGATASLQYPYLHSKWLGEQAVVDSGLPYTILRPSILFGGGDEFVNALAGLVRAFPVVPVAGSGRNRFQPIAVEDVARCIATAVVDNGPANGVIEIGGPQHLTYNQIVDVIARTYGVRRLKLRIPIPIMGLAVKVMEGLLPRPPITTQQLRMVSLDNVGELGTVEESFGFSPKALEGNIGYIRGISYLEALRIALGLMPTRIRDH